MRRYRRNRLALIQVLYQSHFHQRDVATALSDHRFFVVQGLCSKCDYGRVEELLSVFDSRKKDVEKLIALHLSSPRLRDATLSSIVQAAISEILSQNSAPYSVIADEYTTLGRMLLSEKSVSVVNAVLDKIGRSLQGARG